MEFSRNQFETVLKLAMTHMGRLFGVFPPWHSSASRSAALFQVVYLT